MLRQLVKTSPDQEIANCFDRIPNNGSKICNFIFILSIFRYCIVSNFYTFLSIIQRKFILWPLERRIQNSNCNQIRSAQGVTLLKKLLRTMQSQTRYTLHLSAKCQPAIILAKWKVVSNQPNVSGSTGKWRERKMPRLLRFSAGRGSMLEMSFDIISIRDLRGKTQERPSRLLQEFWNAFQWKAINGGVNSLQMGRENKSNNLNWQNQSGIEDFAIQGNSSNFFSAKIISKI